MWLATVAEIFFSSAVLAVCLHANLPPNVHPSGALNFVHSGTCLSLPEFPSWQLPFLMFVRGSLFAFPHDHELWPASFGVPLALPSSLPFSVNFRVSVRWTCRRKWTRWSLPFAFLLWFMFECACFSKWTLASCGATDAVSSHGVVFWHCFCLALVAGLSSSRFLALRILDSMLEMPLGHFFHLNLSFFVAKCRLLSAVLQHVLQFFRLFNLHLVQAFQHVVSGSVSSCW